MMIMQMSKTKKLFETKFTDSTNFMVIKFFLIIFTNKPKNDREHFISRGTEYRALLSDLFLNINRVARRWWRMPLTFAFPSVPDVPNFSKVTNKLRMFY